MMFRCPPSSPPPTVSALVRTMAASPRRRRLIPRLKLLRRNKGGAFDGLIWAVLGEGEKYDFLGIILRLHLRCPRTGHLAEL
ncbi:hypothetical protein VTI74DRAFT_4774 [Chaetomium olivicolor]